MAPREYPCLRLHCLHNDTGKWLSCNQDARTCPRTPASLSLQLSQRPVHGWRAWSLSSSSLVLKPNSSPAPSLLSLAAWPLLSALPAHTSCLAWEATGHMSFSASMQKQLSPQGSWESLFILEPNMNDQGLGRMVHSMFRCVLVSWSFYTNMTKKVINQDLAKYLFLSFLKWFVYFYVYECFNCTCICALGVHGTLRGQRGCQMPRNWS